MFILPEQLPPLLLASASPRRAELLRHLGWSFQVMPVDIDESIQPNENTKAYVLRVAREKALALRQQLPASQQNALILAADTCGEFQGERLLKPVDATDAAAMLKKLSGQTHTIYSAFCLMREKTIHCECVISNVSFATLTTDDINRYINTGEPLDKAGAYAIQGLGAQFIRHLDGSFYAVMGLPIYELIRASALFLKPL